jgi:hypothetical protein
MKEEMKIKMFEKYLESKQAYLLDMITIFKGSKNPSTASKLSEFYIELNVVEDIIYHYNLFTSKSQVSFKNEEIAEDSEKE